MYNKLVILFSGGYDIRINKLLGLEMIAAQGVSVEYWNVERISFSDTVKNVYLPEWLKYEIIEDENDFVRRINANNTETTLYYIHTLYFRWTYRVYRIISKNHCHWMTSVIGRQPHLERSFGRKFDTISINKIWLLMLNKYYQMLKKTPLIKPADYCLFSGTELVLYSGNVCGPCTKYIRFNTTDYQTFLKAKGDYENPEYSKGKIVFIDQYIPLHPDNEIRGEKYDVDSYYNEMNEIFDILERRYNTEVVIAAHPASVKYSEKNYFNGRKVYFGNTVNMVLNSKYVVIHNSTAVAYPVLANKPVIIIYTQQFEGKEIGDYCSMYKKKLNCYFVKREDVESLPLSLNVDIQAYDEYKYSFLTSKETEELSNDKVMMDILKCNDNEDIV